MTATINETETVDLTDHEFAIQCDHIWLPYLDRPRRDCPNPAEWVALKVCCGTPSMLCTGCKDSLLVQDETITFVCRTCDAEHTPPRSTFFNFEPLRRRGKS